MAAAIQGPQQASAAGDAGAADVKGKGRARKDDQPGSSAAANARDEVTFEKDVRFLAQNVSSWWNEFSRKSQEQFSSAQKQIASQGGVFNYARNEASKLEAQIEETRKKVMAQREAEDAVARQAKQAEANENAEKKPGTAADAEGVPFRKEVKPSEDNNSPADPSTSCQGPNPESTESNNARAKPPATLFGRLQTLSTDSRVASLQFDVSKRISSLFISQDAPETTTDGSPMTAQTLAKSVQAALQDVSLSLQKLGGSEGKAYAQRYLKASEDLIGRVGEEWKDMMNELVRVVPAEGAQKASDWYRPEASNSTAAKGVPVSSGKETGTKTEMASPRASSQSSLLSLPQPASSSSVAVDPSRPYAPSQPPTAQPPNGAEKPSTKSASSTTGSTDDEDAFSWEDGAASADNSSKVSTVAAPSPTNAQASAPTPSAAARADQDSDSDWE